MILAILIAAQPICEPHHRPLWCYNQTTRTIPADDPCDYRYSRETHGEFYSDDHPYGPMPGCRRR